MCNNSLCETLVFLITIFSAFVLLWWTKLPSSCWWWACLICSAANKSCIPNNLFVLPFLSHLDKKKSFLFYYFPRSDRNRPWIQLVGLSSLKDKTQKPWRSLSHWFPGQCRLLQGRVLSDTVGCRDSWDDVAPDGSIQAKMLTFLPGLLHGAAQWRGTLVRCRRTTAQWVLLVILQEFRLHMGCLVKWLLGYKVCEDSFIFSFEYGNKDTG